MEEAPAGNVSGYGAWLRYLKKKQTYGIKWVITTVFIAIIRC